MGALLAPDQHRADLAEFGGDQFAGQLEARHRPAIERDEHRDACPLGHIEDAPALGTGASHRLLDVDRLARLRDTNGVVAVRIGRRGDVDGVDLGVGDQASASS